MVGDQSIGPTFPNLTLALLEVGKAGPTVSAAPTEESLKEQKPNLFLTAPCQAALRKFQRTEANLRMAALLSGVASVAATALGGWMINNYRVGGEGIYHPEGIAGGAVLASFGLAAGIGTGILIWQSNQPFESDLCFNKPPRVPRQPDVDWDE